MDSFSRSRHMFVATKIYKKLCYLRGTARYVSKFVLCFTKYGSQKGFKQQK